MSKREEIRNRHEVESAMDTNDQYSEWSQPALAGRLRQSNRDRATLLAMLDKCAALVERWREGDFDLPDYVRGKMDGCHQCAEELRALLDENDD